MASYDRALRQDIIEWDVDNWGHALEIWDRRRFSDRARALEVGSRNGGLSLYLALRGCEVTCSDRGAPRDAARALHARHGVADQVTYADVDATAMPFGDASFDVVAFKSVLGGVGGALGFEGQQRAVAEILRVLRPGGTLLFAENMAASRVHALLRRTLVPWGARWRYLATAELATLLAPFADVDAEFHGCLATFGRREWQRSVLHHLDRIAERVVPDRWKYIVVGSATKSVQAAHA